jgi:hypothetical protein
VYLSFCSAYLSSLGIPTYSSLTFSLMMYSEQSCCCPYVRRCTHQRNWLQMIIFVLHKTNCLKPVSFLMHCLPRGPYCVVNFINFSCTDVGPAHCLHFSHYYKLHCNKVHNQMTIYIDQSRTFEMIYVYGSTFWC